jgi:hypothetical protein
MRTIEPFDIRRGEIKFPRDQMREAIRILQCEAQGRPISGYFDSAGVRVWRLGSSRRDRRSNRCLDLRRRLGSGRLSHSHGVLQRSFRFDALELRCGQRPIPVSPDRALGRGRPSPLPSELVFLSLAPGVPMFNRNRDDLNFLLTQVAIGTDYSRLSSALDPERTARGIGQQQQFDWRA